MKIRATRNKTITLSEEEAQEFQQRLFPASAIGADLPLDRTIHANLLDVLDKLPDHFADLIIIDPPYNLNKNFGQTAFRSSSNDEYREYLHEWLPLVCCKLKETGSLYICGDWRSSAALYEELSQCLHIMNRITWQREKGRGSMHNWKNAMEDMTVSGGALMSGVMLKPLFRGTGYDENQRTQGDFGSDVYVIEEVE